MRKSLFRGAGVAGLGGVVGVVGALVAASVVVPSSAVVALPAGGAVATVVSSSPTGVPGNGESSELSMSHDGRYVAFVSKATNLTSTSGSAAQVYRKDLETGEVVLVSADAAGQPGDDGSSQPTISGDGSKVAFVSRSTNFDGGSSGFTQIYVRDLTAPGGVVLLTRTPTNWPGNGFSYDPAISANGNIVAFTSAATDLVEGATSRGTQVFAASLGVPKTISFVSLQNLRLDPDLANETASHPSISADGSIVTFTSAASNFAADTPKFRTQIWMRNLAAGSTALVSRGPTGNGTTVDSAGSVVLADGSKVVYSEGGQITLSDLVSDSNTLISADRTGLGKADGTSYAPAMSADGSAVAFVSQARNLTTSWTFTSQVYRRDLRSGVTTMMSTAALDPTRGSSQGAEDFAMSGDGSTVGFSTWDRTITDPPATGKQIYAREIAAPSVDRIGGADRYGVAAGVGADTFGSDRDVVYVATGAGFADALSASAAAGAGGGPVLLVTADAIPTDTGAELARLRPRKIVVAGGVNTISPAVEAALKKYSATVERIGGVDRYAVSAAMAAAAFPTGPLQKVYLASGQVFPDALAGAAATAGRGPVLLVTKDGVPDPVKAQLARLAPSEIVVLGGPNTISEAVLATLPRSATVTRVGGADRFAVSANVSAANFDPHVGTAYVASGAVFPDALSGSAAAIANHAPVLLVTRDGIPEAVAAELERLKPRRIVVLGGSATVSDAVQSDLGRFLVP
ncbi:cell wall-binding repeat-containing protein [Herbiconiux liukaitaii]|uniref:cell wall-binding repeat-containing protein n=1 Tax=Herbiconiux liukaitaii TaxID=3342799 RepID=UPI0035B8B0A4